VDSHCLTTGPRRVRTVHRLTDGREEKLGLTRSGAYGVVVGGAAVVFGVAVLIGRRLTLRT
jgi:hypothetical protein